ncbi:MAG TPA: hypothetical protein VGD37_32595 [Kofleriaceae bacterium]|jgi:hypothetical protein
MIEVSTYVFAGRAYHPIAELHTPVADPDYIKGAIELSIDGVDIITRAEWDLVDQLWAYLVNGACELASGRSFATRFPDQPIELLFTAGEHDDGVTVEIRYRGVGRPAKARVGRRELIVAIADAAEPVFTKLLELAPSNRAGYEAVLRQIESLMRSTSGSS